MEPDTPVLASDVPHPQTLEVAGAARFDDDIPQPATALPSSPDAERALGSQAARPASPVRCSRASSAPSAPLAPGTNPACALASALPRALLRSPRPCDVLYHAYCSSRYRMLNDIVIFATTSVLNQGVLLRVRFLFLQPAFRRLATDTPLFDSPV
jgi:hypothetical protein